MVEVKAGFAARERRETPARGNLNRGRSMTGIVCVRLLVGSRREEKRGQGTRREMQLAKPRVFLTLTLGIRPLELFAPPGTGTALARYG
jgi:hypothetical protein